MPHAAPPLVHSRRLLGWFGLVLLAGYWIGLECLTIRHGCDFRDTGRAATIAYQHANGDRPFVDSALSSVHLTEFYASWFVRWKPDATMLGLRVFSSVIQFIGIAAAYWLLLRLASPLHVTAAMILSVAGIKAWFTWPLHYDKLAATLSVCSVAVYFLAIRRRRPDLPQHPSEASPVKGELEGCLDGVGAFRSYAASNDGSNLKWILAALSGVLACLAGSARIPHLAMAALPIAAWSAARIVGAERRRLWLSSLSENRVARASSPCVNTKNTGKIPVPRVSDGVFRQTLSAVAFWVGFASTAAGLIAWIAASGYWNAAVNRFQLFLTRRSYGSESTGYLTTATLEICWITAATAAFIVVAALIAAAIERRWAWPGMAALAVALVVAYFAYLHDVSWHHQRLIGLGVAGSLVFALNPRPAGFHSHTDFLRFDRAFVATAGLLLACMATVGSNLGLRTAIHSGQLLLPLGIIGVLELPGIVRRATISSFSPKRAEIGCVILSAAKNLNRSSQKAARNVGVEMLRCAQHDTQPWLVRVTAWGMASAVGAASLLFYLQNGMFLDQYSIRDPATYGEFKSGRMAGVRADAKRVALFEELIACVKGQVRPNDFILAYYDMALVYFATDTRPAVFDSWLMLDHPPEYERAALDYMLAHNRIPKLVIRTQVVPNRHWPRLWRKSAYPPDAYDASDPAKHPINAWVEGHFTLDRCIGPFEVWRPVEGDRLSLGRQIARGGFSEESKVEIPAEAAAK